MNRGLARGNMHTHLDTTLLMQRNAVLFRFSIVRPTNALNQTSQSAFSPSRCLRSRDARICTTPLPACFSHLHTVPKHRHGLTCGRHVSPPALMTQTKKSCHGPFRPPTSTGGSKGGHPEASLISIDAALGGFEQHTTIRPAANPNAQVNQFAIEQKKNISANVAWKPPHARAKPNTMPYIHQTKPNS